MLLDEKILKGKHYKMGDFWEGWTEGKARVKGGQKAEIG